MIDVKNNFAINPDEITIEQFDECTSHDFVKKAALMPDAHAGYAAPIGSVLVTKDTVVPAWVGFDIGCGMTSAHIHGISLQEIKDNAQKIYDHIKANVPMGMGVYNKRENLSKEAVTRYNEILETFKQGPHDKNVLQFFEGKSINHIGSLGDGNHFIEIGEHEDEAWITIHSGSRGVGFKVAEKYMKKSAGGDKNFEQTFPLEVNSQLGQEYLNVLDFGLEFALLNRLEMIRSTVKAIGEFLGKDLTHDVWVNKNHNHAILENGHFIHRKGATPAKKGERGVIPANMKDGCFLVEGLGNKDFLESSSHGAGRIMSRKGASSAITMDQFKESMKGIVGTVTEGTIDEAPMAYKNIYDVMEKQKESVRAVKLLKPIINWKGERRRFRRRKNN